MDSATCRPKGLYNWDPGAYFGIYHPDTFYFDENVVRKAADDAGVASRSFIDGCGTHDKASMLTYVIRRLLIMIPTLIAISVIVFIIIQLPPGDYLESYIAELQAQGESVDPQKIAFLREQYGLDQPLWEQYLRWVGGMLRRRLRLLVRVQPAGVGKVDRRPDDPDDHRSRLFTILFTWAIAFPIGIYSATHQYSWGDYGLHAARLPRDRHPELPAGAGDDVSRQRLVRHVDRRPDGPRVHRPAVELGEGRSRCSITCGSRCS